MQRSTLSKFIGSAVLTLGLIALPSHVPASAQTSAPASPTDTVPPATNAPDAMSTDTTPQQTSQRGDRDFDWGWLGLLGLIGLAGLSRKDEPVARYREPDEISTPSNPRY